jgi:SagB-type dehydrogenase family enzyme
MQSTSFFILTIVWALSIMCVTVSYSDERKAVKLPNPQVDNGRPLMQVLRDRSSSRSFSTQKISDQILSNLLWAAFGINRPDTGRRTAPSAVNWQEIDIYVATAEGLYLYEAKTQTLEPVLSGDMRSATGKQVYVKEAPVNLIYVADFSRMRTASQEDKEFYSAADTGFISQNVYLYCASEGLGTVVRGSIDKQALAKTMNLRSDQKIILAQSVGYPKNNGTF